MFKLSRNCYIAPFRELWKSFTKIFLSDDDIYIIRQGLRSTKPIEIYQKCINHYSAPWYEILKNSIENFPRYLEICRFYVDFNHSFGRGLRSINTIDLIIEKSLYFILRYLR